MKSKLLKNRVIFWLVICIIALGLILTAVYLYKRFMPNTSIVEGVANLPVYSTDNLALYDGTDPAKPIYIGLNGYVYDVTPGKEFYQTGGGYHFLAGKDSSSELNIIGGDIIARKYKIIGRLQ